MRDVGGSSGAMNRAAGLRMMDAEIAQAGLLRRNAERGHPTIHKISQERIAFVFLREPGGFASRTAASVIPISPLGCFVFIDQPASARIIHVGLQ